MDYFEVPAFVAKHLGCDVGAIVGLGGPVDRGRAGLSASYARRPSAAVAAQVTISPRRRNLAGVVRRLVTATSDREAGTQTDIGPDEAVEW